MSEYYNGLFESLQGIKSVQTRRKTFMDVSGYPHYENVVSNILAFLLDDSEEHGMQNLWMNALLTISLDSERKRETQGISVEREVFTKNGNRIDILISSDDYIVCIENKIFAGVGNDLLDYKNTAEERITNENELKGKELICLVLSLDCAKYEENSFKNVLYKDLFEEVRKNIGHYLDVCDNTWLTYVKDFMATIEVLSGGNMYNQEFQKMYQKHHLDIKRLEEEKVAYLNAIKKETSEVQDILKNKWKMLREEYEYPCDAKVWDTPYASKAEVRTSAIIDLNLDLKGSKCVAIETSRDAWGWHIALLDRKGKEAKDLVRKCFGKQISHTAQLVNGETVETSGQFYKNHYIVKNLEESFKANEVADEICNAIKSILPIIKNEL